MHSLFRTRQVAALLLVSAAAGLPTLAAQANSAGVAGFTDPREIDRVVAEFTGVNIGQVGGARLPADPRLRLTACNGPLLADWHGPAHTTVSVACPDPGGWRIFVATRAPATSAKPSLAAVKRGDPITIQVRGRGFSVQQTGEAMEAGGIGDWIAIRTSRRGEPIRARIERPGLAVIPAN